MSELYELPDGWEWKILSEVLKMKSGNLLSKKNMIEDGKYNVYGGNGINGKYNQSNLNGENIVIGRVGALCGNVRYINESIWITDNAFYISKYINEINKKYLTKFLSYINLGKTANQSAQPVISNKGISKLPIPIPPLSEQQRIVSKLDLLFEKIDKSIALHQENMDESDVFMGSVLNDVFGELEERYELDSIGNMIDLLTDYHSNGAYKSLKANVELLDKEDYSLMIRATDLEKKDYTNNVKYITESAYNFMAKSKVYGGEIILPKIGSIGNVYFMPYLDRPISLAMNLFMLRCSHNVMNKYMFLYLISPKGYTSILSKANGAVTKTITKDAVRSIELALPPLNIQKKTVKYLDKISEKNQKIKQVQKEKMQNLIALKASILDQAFRGKL